jgi:GDP-4-dehydro-6-deoxy-D-mannose reductase
VNRAVGDGSTSGSARGGSATGGRALVTGAAGFVGQHLVRALLADGWEVTAAALDTPGPAQAGVWWRCGDLRAPDFAEALVDAAAPDLVVHLAAISHLPTAAADPGAAWDTNVTASVRLLAALGRRADRAAPRVLVVGSGEQYGRQAMGDRPLREDDPLEPRTVYAATKLGQEVAALQLWRATGLPVVAVRPFNHSGAGQDPRFLLPALVRRALALRESPRGTPLSLGNTAPVRDFLHVSDVVAAYIALGRDGTPGTVYNVASGVGRSVREVAERILARVGLDAPLREDPSLVRPVDVPSLVGDPARLIAATEWRPRFSFDDLLDDLLHAATH